MLKKLIILLISLLFFTGCSMYSLDKMTVESVIEFAISQDFDLYNINSKGYRYYLPREFSLLDDYDFNQVLVSNGKRYYLNVDIVGYHYQSNMSSTHGENAYKFFTFGNNNKTGYLDITQNNDYFFIELCYNYAIIEVQVKENEIKDAVSRAIYILSSIKYNDKIINNLIGEGLLQFPESKYELEKPKGEEDNRNILTYPDRAKDEANSSSEEQ